MSSLSAQKSNEASDPLESDSVYDFLYQDVKRIASFLGQFDKDGHLTGLVRTSSVSETSGSTYGMGGGIGLPSVANLTANGNEATSETGSDLSPPIRSYQRKDSPEDED